MIPIVLLNISQEDDRNLLNENEDKQKLTVLIIVLNNKNNSFCNNISILKNNNYICNMYVQVKFSKNYYNIEDKLLYSDIHIECMRIIRPLTIDLVDCRMKKKKRLCIDSSSFLFKRNKKILVHSGRFL